MNAKNTGYPAPELALQDGALLTCGFLYSGVITNTIGALKQEAIVPPTSPTSLLYFNTAPF